MGQLWDQRSPKTLLAEWKGHGESITDCAFLGGAPSRSAATWDCAYAMTPCPRHAAN